jgi:hypothetical protein
MNCRDTGGEAALYTHCDLFATQRGRSGRNLELLAEWCDEIRAATNGRDPRQLGQRKGTANPIGDKPEVSLKLGESDVRAVPKNPVHPARIEPESAQTPLYLGDVVSLQHGNAPVQKSVAKAKTGFHEARPGLAAAYSIHAQAPLGLKFLHGSGCVGTEDPKGVLALLEPKPPESFLHVGHSVADVTFA